MTKVNINDLEVILGGANLIQKGEEYLLEIEKLKGEGRDELPIEVVYEMAESYGIEKSSIDHFIKIRFPSGEMQRETRAELDAGITFESISQLYEKTFLEELKRKSPHEAWKSNHPLFAEENYKFNIYLEGEKGFFIRKKKNFATISFKEPALFGRWKCKIIIEEPFFAEACKDKLAELKNRFSNSLKYNVITTYLV
jgi:hypothetical protein